MNILLATADALSNGVGAVLLTALIAFAAALIHEQVTLIRKSLTTKENQQP